MDFVKNVMDDKIVTCEQKDSLQSVAKKMFNYDVAFIPIVDDNKRLLGIISDRDITMTVGSNESIIVSDFKVEDAHISESLSVSPEENIEIVLRLMRKKRIKCLPVVDKTHRLQGTVSLNRLVRRINGTAWERKMRKANDEKKMLINPELET